MLAGPPQARSAASNVPPRRDRETSTRTRRGRPRADGGVGGYSAGAAPTPSRVAAHGESRVGGLPGRSPIAGAARARCVGERGRGAALVLVWGASARGRGQLGELLAEQPRRLLVD